MVEYDSSTENICTPFTRVAQPETTSSFLDQKVETLAVVVSKENWLTSDPHENDMLESAGEMNAWFSCQNITKQQGTPREWPCRLIVSVSR